jgi:hypothetical protein
LAFQDHEHGVSRIALSQVRFTCFERDFLRLADEPVKLIVRQVCKYRNAAQL